MTRKSAKKRPNLLAGECDQCGNVNVLRPYGPNGENICYECGMKNGAVTIRQLCQVEDGIDMPLTEAQRIFEKYSKEHK